MIRGTISKVADGVPASTPMDLTDREWMDRGEAFRQIPEAFENSAGALRHIDDLRQENCDGNDLYFLYLATEDLAQREPPLGEAVRDVQRRFFEHLPKPPEPLFRDIETPIDGRIDWWRQIPAGEYLVGSPPQKAPEDLAQEDERPRRRVVLERPLFMSATPVTRRQFAAFRPGPNATGSGEMEDNPQHPITHITWYEATSFCRWLSSGLRSSAEIRLPREEEWEIACRAGTKTLYWPGDGVKDLCSVGWFRENSSRQTHRVGEKPANLWGLYDLHGNVREWTLSRYSRWSKNHRDPPPREDLEDRLGEPTEGYRRVLRGGGYWDLAAFTRSAVRSVRQSGVRYPSLGFRILRSTGDT